MRQIRDELKMSRKTIHKYLRRLAVQGLSRERPLPEEEQLAQMVASVLNPAVFEQPARERIPQHLNIPVSGRNVEDYLRAIRIQVVYF